VSTSGGPIRRLLGQIRRASIRALGGDVPAGLQSDTPVRSVDQVLRLLYPAADVPRLRPMAEGLVDDDESDLQNLRRVLGGLDRQIAASPIAVRFGPEDLVEHRSRDGFVLFLDRADPSVSRQIADSTTYEPHLTAVFREYCAPGMTVVDVGANIGYFSLLASRLVGASGRVVAIEPNSENCRLILLSADVNGAANVELLPVALDQQRGWAYFSSHVGSNGGLIPGSPSDLVEGRGTVVPTFALDELVDGPVHFIKFDVEGAEGRAVAGARNLIEKWLPLMTTELSLEMLGRVSGINGEDFLRWFEALGYEIAILNRTTNRPDPPISAAQLLANWAGPLHIEDLLLLPPH